MHLLNKVGFQFAKSRNYIIIQDLDAVEALIQGLVLFQGGICMVLTQSDGFQD